MVEGREFGPFYVSQNIVTEKAASVDRAFCAYVEGPGHVPEPG